MMCFSILDTLPNTAKVDQGLNLQVLLTELLSIEQSNLTLPWGSLREDMLTRAICPHVWSVTDCGLGSSTNGASSYHTCSSCRLLGEQHGCVARMDPGWAGSSARIHLATLVARHVVES